MKRGQTRRERTWSISKLRLHQDSGSTYWSLRSRSSSCSLKEIPRTGPFWIRFIKWVVTAHQQKVEGQGGVHVQPEILFLRRLEGTDATSSRRRLLVLECQYWFSWIARPAIPLSPPSSPRLQRILGAIPLFLRSFNPSHSHSSRLPCALSMSASSISQQCIGNLLEVEGEAGVVFLNENPGGTLDRLCPDSSLLFRIHHIQQKCELIRSWYSSRAIRGRINICR